MNCYAIEREFLLNMERENVSSNRNIGIIFAGGVGSRMHSCDLPKQFIEVENKPIIIHTIEIFESNNQIDSIVVVCVEDWIQYFSDLVDKYALKKVSKIVPGGKTGQLSIYNGLVAAKELTGDNSAIVLIHDGVRPLISSDLLSRNIEDVRKFGSSITSSYVTETIVEIDDEGFIKYVPSRQHSMVAKAPQCFYLEEILTAHIKALNDGITTFIDSCSLMKHYGYRLHMTDGPYDNIKITTERDLLILRAIFSSGLIS